MKVIALISVNPVSPFPVLRRHDVIGKVRARAVVIVVLVMVFGVLSAALPEASGLDGVGVGAGAGAPPVRAEASAAASSLPPATSPSSDAVQVKESTLFGFEVGLAVALIVVVSRKRRR